MIRKINDEIRINQDYDGSYGLYYYKNKETGYFALSNSFLLLEEYLIGKQNMTFNKDFSDNFIISTFCSTAIKETMINEIIKFPSNVFIILNIKTKDLKIYNINYEENTIPLESEEGLKIIDIWMDKWTYIIRSIKKRTNNFSFDLSGGLDTRGILPILLNSGININSILIHSKTDKVHGHDEDFQIASNISKRYGFKLNNKNLDNDSIKWGTKNTLFGTIYSKLGFHKEFYFKDRFYNKPRISFSGCGGEVIRGFPCSPMNEYANSISSIGKKIKGNGQEIYHSSMRFFDRNINLLRMGKTYHNDYELSSDFYIKGCNRNHCGKSALESFVANIYNLRPLLDPLLRKINFDISGSSPHDLLAFIYIRFGQDLINYPFQGNRKINDSSIEKAKNLIKKIPPYRIKSNYNKNFFIDKARKCPAFPSKKSNIYEYLNAFFNSTKFINYINKIYNNSVIDWANEYGYKSKFFPIKHKYGLLAIYKVIKDLTTNKKFLEKKSINLL